MLGNEIARLSKSSGVNLPVSLVHRMHKDQRFLYLPMHAQSTVSSAFCDSLLIPIFFVKQVLPILQTLVEMCHMFLFLLPANLQFRVRPQRLSQVIFDLLDQGSRFENLGE